MGKGPSSLCHIPLDWAGPELALHREGGGENKVLWATSPSPRPGRLLPSLWKEPCPRWGMTGNKGRCLSTPAGGAMPGPSPPVPRCVTRQPRVSPG